MAEPTIEDQMLCVSRELKMRRRGFPRWVEVGRMTQAQADREIETMEAVLRTLEKLRQPPAQGGLL